MEVELTDPMVKTDIFDQYWSCLIFSLSLVWIFFVFIVQGRSYKWSPTLHSFSYHICLVQVEILGRTLLGFHSLVLKEKPNTEKGCQSTQCSATEGV